MDLNKIIAEEAAALNEQHLRAFKESVRGKLAVIAQKQAAIKKIEIEIEQAKKELKELQYEPLNIDSL